MTFHRAILSILLLLLVGSLLATPMNKRTYKIIQNSIKTSKDKDQVYDFTPGLGAMLRSSDGEVSALLNYLIQIDSVWLTNNPTASNGLGIPLSKAYLSGNIHRLTYYMSYDFAQTNLDQANVGIGWKHFNTQAGQIEPYFGLVNDVGDNAYNFIAVPLNVAAFSPNYSEGLVFEAYSPHFVQQGTIFGQSANTTSGPATTLNATLRTLYVPIHSKHKVLHFAVNGWTNTVGSPHQAQFFSLPGINLATARSMVNTSSIPNVKTYQVFDGEFVGLKGPFNFQSEYTYTWVNRMNSQPTLHFSGYYFIASYFLTGESRDYQYPDGYFIGITKIRHRYGAVQLLARYSALNLNSDNVHGGAEYDYAAGLNWYITRMAELSVNYIHANGNPTFSGSHQTSNIYALRLQIGL
ncbi:MAG: porin [Coxiellaceae bacterium]|nr:porin [Coxiellaceae bacterium]